MIIVYAPEGEPEQRIPVKLDRVLLPEAIAIEKRTGWDYDAFKVRLIQGNALARLAMLHILLKRTHPGLNFDDLASTLPVGGVRAEFDREELDDMLDKARTDPAVKDEDRGEIIAAINRMIAGSGDVEVPKDQIASDGETVS